MSDSSGSGPRRTLSYGERPDTSSTRPNTAGQPGTRPNTAGQPGTRPNTAGQPMDPLSKRPDTASQSSEHLIKRPNTTGESSVSLGKQTGAPGRGPNPGRTASPLAFANTITEEDLLPAGDYAEDEPTEAAFAHTMAPDVAFAHTVSSDDALEQLPDFDGGNTLDHVPGTQPQTGNSAAMRAQTGNSAAMRAQTGSSARNAQTDSGDIDAGSTMSRKKKRPDTRAYADGVFTTLARSIVPAGSPETSGAVPLPYNYSDILGRIGSYDLLEELGRGGMGVVYKAYSLKLCRLCALKVMISGEHASPVELTRFENEARLAGRLDHPNIVSVFDAGDDDGWFYFVMRYVEGEPLNRLIAEGTEDGLRRGLRALAEVARALHYAHEKGIVHRDIKPDNILIDKDGHPHITDFGIAKSIEAKVGMTAQGALMGTPSYMAPEQANGEIAAIGPRSDVYSLGATLYHLATGRPPFLGDTVYDVLDQVLNIDPPPPREVARRTRKYEVPLDVEIICLKAMEKRASQRYPTALAMAEDIEAYLDDRPISARAVSATERLQKLFRRNRGMFLVAAIVFATLLVVGGSFSAVMISTIQKTSESLRTQDQQAALDQAATMERSIRVNMLQGRADVVRELVQKLREDPNFTSLEVVRTDRTFAYTDLSTRKLVERRLSDPQILERIRTKYPKLVPKIEEVKETAFANIDQNRKVAGSLFEYDRAAWNALMKNPETVVRAEREGGEPMLTVLKPIENTDECQACHGEEDEGGYGPNKVRAMLVIKRSQKAVEAKIEENKRTTLIVGATTASIILVLVWLFSRLFGVRLRRRHYAA